MRALIRPTADGAKRAELEGSASNLSRAISRIRRSLARACAGVQAVISTASSTLSRQAGDSIESVDQHGQLALVDAARAAGRRTFRVRVVSRKPAVFSFR